MRLVAKMKICFVSFPLEKNLKAQGELTNIYGNCNPEDADFIVALGGDGFILKSLRFNLCFLDNQFLNGIKALFLIINYSRLSLAKII